MKDENGNPPARQGFERPRGRAMKVIICPAAFLDIDLIAGSRYLLVTPRLVRLHSLPDACGAIPRRWRR
jgi:hypothetical protein